MVRGFYYKLTVLFFVLCSVSALILLVAIMPSYFLSGAKKRIVNTKLLLQKSEQVPLPDQATLAIIKDLDDKLNVIERSKNDKFIISEKVINAILSKKTSSIKITEISYDNGQANLKAGSTAKKISIKGIAPSREHLFLFREALEEDTSFKQVDLPISNFIKGSDIQFYLDLIPE